MELKMVNICFIGLEYATNEACGAGVYAWNLTKAIADLGHNVHVITWGSIKIKERNNLHIHVPPVNHSIFPQLLCKLLYLFSIPFLLLKIKKTSQGIDLIHVNAQFFSALICAFSTCLIPYLAAIPKVLTLHHSNYYEYLIDRRQSLTKNTRLFVRRFSTIVESIVVKKYDSIITVSEFTRKSLIETYALDQRKISVVFNGVVPPSKKNFKNFFPKKNGEVWLLSVGRNEPRKAYGVLLDAFKNVSIKFPQVKLILVGKGITKNQLLTGHDNVLLYDYLDSEKLMNMYNLCDVYVSASTLEGFGLTVFEAMAAGKPIIAAKNGGISEFVKNMVNGMLVEPNNSRALYEGIIYMLMNKKSWKPIGQNNANYVRSTFKWELTGKKTIDIYSKLINS